MPELVSLDAAMVVRLRFSVEIRALVCTRTLDDYDQVTPVRADRLFSAVDPETKEFCVLKRFSVLGEQRGDSSVRRLVRHCAILACLAHNSAIIDAQAVFENKAGEWFVQSPRVEGDLQQ
jgi:hypothetical protein